MSDVSIQSGLSRGELLAQVEELLRGERNALANMANLASLLYFSMPNLNWAGFYLRQEDELVLGPFQGRPACVRIAVGRGVCGTAVARGETLVVEDVDLFPGHIACDAASRSETVVPMRLRGQIVGVMDIDSPLPARFDAEDRTFFEACVSLLVDSSDGWEELSTLPDDPGGDISKG